MILDKIWTFYVCLCLDIYGLEILFDDHQVKIQALLYYKKWILHRSHIGFFKVVNP